LNLSGWIGAHTTFPMLQMPIAEFAADKEGKTRDIVMIVNESILNECNEARQMIWFADVSIENRPMVVSSWTVPEASGSFCQRARDRRARSLPSEGDRLLHPGDHRSDRQALRQGRRQGPLQGRNPDQQR